MSTDDLSAWEAEMANLGVRRIGEPAKRGKPGASKAPGQRLPPGAPSTSPRLAPEAKATPAPPRGALPAAPTAAFAPSPMERALGEAQAERDALRAKVAALEAAARAADAALTEERGARAAAERRADELSAHAAGVDRRLATVEAQLKASRAGEADPNRVLLTDALAGRGLIAGTEADLLLRAVADAHLGSKLLALLTADDREALEDFLTEDVALSGGCPSCPRPSGRAVVEVPRARCDVCGGSDIRRTVRDFEQAALLCGVTRVVIVGGSAQYRRTLRELVPKDRITLTLVPGDKRRHQSDARADLRNNDLVVIWGATELDHSVSENYTRLPHERGRLWAVNHRGIARMLAALAEHLRTL